MTFLNKYISTIILFAGLLNSCSTSNENKKADLNPKADNNKFPIEYVGDKVLEYNKPMVHPKGGPAHLVDTFNLYRLTNKSFDTIWVNTIKPRQDTSWYFFKDTTIKEITMSKISHRYIDRNYWLLSSDGNCWGNCDYRVKLLPNQNLLFIMGNKGLPNFDSTKFNILIKIKKGLKIIDSTVTKRLVYDKNCFIDDTTKWTNKM